MHYRILCVHDDPATSDDLRCLLENAGYVVTAENDSAQALEVARNFRPHAVILNSQSNGADVVGQLASDPALRGTKVIICSAATKAEALQKLPSVPKPILEMPARAEDLLALIDQNLAGGESQARATEFVAKTGDIAPFPESLVKLLDLIRQTEVPMDEVVSVVQEDAVLSANLLRTCNSPALSLRQKVSSVQHAVVLLGMEEVHRVTVAVGVKGTMGKALKNYALDARQFWHHSLVTAHAAALLARNVVYISPPVAYTAGLLHDIGKLVIDRVMTAENRASIALLQRDENLMGFEAEQKVMGTNHAETGGCLLRKWGLPTLLVEAAEDHHEPICHPVPELACVVYLANILSHHSEDGSGSELQLSPRDLEVAAGLGLGRQDLADEWGALQKKMEKLTKFSSM